MIKHTRVISFVIFNIFVLVLISSTGFSQPATPYEQVPWSLRDHYTFGGTLLCLDYAKGNGELRIRRKQDENQNSNMNPDVVVSSVGFSIEFGDGRIITNDMLGHGGETEFGREQMNSTLYGEGTVFSVKFSPYEGLLVEHRITRFKNWNFLLIAINVANNSDTPVLITRIQSAVLGTGSICGLSENAIVNARNFIFRGGYPVYTHDNGAAMFMIHDSAGNIDLALGILPSGTANSRIDIQPGGGTWQGSVESSYAPGITVAPNQSLQSDPLWFCMDTLPVVADAQFAWLIQEYCRKESAKNMPRSWVTIPDTQGISALVREATDARDFGISHALIPGNWEGRPGSLEGGAPQYPRNIGNAAQALRDAGVTPGITLDPLRGNGKSENWMAQSVDGSTWINLNDEKGHEFAVKRLRKLIDCGFGFIVIEDSQIPDEVLRSFDITAAQAFNLAVDAVIEAADTSPVAVLPATKASLAPVRDDWLSASAAVSRMVEYGIGTASVQCALQEKDSLNDEAVLAMSFWRGPVEFVGSPHHAVKSQLAGIFTGKATCARPQDGYLKAPLSWLFRSSNSTVGHIGSSILQFPGAPAWRVQDTELFGNEKAPSLAWYLENDTPVITKEGLLKSTDKLITYGVLASSEQPHFAGTTQPVTLGLERLKSLSWDNERLILHGVLESGPAASKAFFLLPSTLAFESAQVNSTRVKAENQEQWVSLPLTASGGSFELKLKTR